MTLRTRRLTATSILCLMVALGGAWAWEYLDDQQSAAASALRELADCRALGRQIEAARLTPAIAPRSGDITAAITSAAAQAGLAEDSLDHIDPGLTRRNTNGTAVQREIDLSIRQATLQQIITFGRALSAPSVGLCANRLTLTPSESDSGGWAAQMSLTYRASGDLTP